MAGLRFLFVVCLVFLPLAGSQAHDNPGAQREGVALYQQAMALAAHGQATEVDWTRVRDLLDQAAARDNQEARYALGWLLYSGPAGLRDPDRAARLIGLAARAGHTPSQHLLGVFYARGVGVARDNGLAIHWALRAAEGGHEPARRLVAGLRRGGLSSGAPGGLPGERRPMEGRGSK